MASYVFLNSFPNDRMPSGEAGEWEEFWRDGGVELEAKNGIPLLWWCLFGATDLKRARLIDDFDIGDPQRDEMMEEMANGAEATYPYLVTDKAQACARFAARRARVLDAIGQQFAGVYDGFGRLIEQRFGPFIGLRTSGLPDAADAEGGLRDVAVAMDRLGESQGSPFNAMAADFRRWKAQNPIWLLSGAGEAGVWPTPELAAAFPGGARTRVGSASSTPGPAQTIKPSRPLRGGARFAVEWGAALVVGGSAVGAYLWTSSVLLGILAFVAAVGLVAWLLKSKL